MKVEFKVTPSLIAMTALCGFVGLMALVAAFPDSYVLWPKTSSDWAAWVQAIGAVGAILWSGHLVNRQINANRKADEDRFNRRMNAYAAFFESAHTSATEALENCSSVANACAYTEYGHDARLFNDLKSALMEPKFSEMESGDGVFALIYMRRAMQDIERLLKRVASINLEEECPPDLDDDYVAERDRAKRYLDDAMSRFKAATHQAL